MGIATVFFVIVLMAFMVESLCEAVFGTLAEKVPALTPFSWVIMYLAMGIGVVGAFIYQFDILSLLGSYLELSIQITWFGIVLTGLAIGRGSNYLHDLVKRFFVKQ